MWLSSLNLNFICLVLFYVSKLMMHMSTFFMRITSLCRGAAFLRGSRFWCFKWHGPLICTSLIPTIFWWASFYIGVLLLRIEKLTFFWVYSGPCQLLLIFLLFILSKRLHNTCELCYVFSYLCRSLIWYYE